MGKAWKFGENLNTDEIIPARFNITIDEKELARKVFCEIKPGLCAQRASRAMWWWPGGILAAVPRASMPRWPSADRR